MANLTVEELKNIEIEQWCDIRPNNTDVKTDLFLGNGFSIRISDTFSYPSLFDKLVEKTSKDFDFEKLSNEFNTVVFEIILKHLMYARKVNLVFNLSTDKIDKSIESLKNGLIESVKENHPSKDETRDRIFYDYADKLKPFGNIFTTNYDLCLYKIILAYNETHGQNKTTNYYRDYFHGEYNDGISNEKYKKFNRGQIFQERNIYYLHGSLFIYNRGYNVVKLVTQPTKELIETVTDEIRDESFPVFVTGGTAEDKLNAIHENCYLDFCWDNFSIARAPLLIFGHSLSECNDHIVNVLDLSQRKLIKSIYTVGRTKSDLIQEINLLRSRFPRHDKSTLVFVDTESVFSDSTTGMS